MKTVLLCLTVLLLAACDRPAVPPADMLLPAKPATEAQTSAPRSTPMSPDTIASFDGYGALRFGMPVDEARKASRGEWVTAGPRHQPCYYLTPKRERVPSDFALMIEQGKLARIDVGTDQEVAPGGGKVGTSADEIRRLYGTRIEQRDHKYVEGGHYLRVQDANGGKGVLLFETDDSNKVTRWRIGLPPQVDYVEGCS